MTKMTWDNPLLMGPTMAERCLQSKDMVKLSCRTAKVSTLPVWIQAGHPDNSVTVFLGIWAAAGRPRRQRAGLRYLSIALQRDSMVRDR